MISRFTPALQAILLSLMAYACFSLADACAKYLVQIYTASLCLVISSLAATLLLFARIMIDKGIAGFHTKKIKLHLIRAVLIAIMANLVVRALETMPLPDLYGIIFLIPFIVVLLSTLILKEPLKPYRLAVIAIAFAGVLIIAGPKFNALSTGMLLTFIVVFVSAINVFVMRRIGQHEYLPLYGFFPFLGIFLSALPQSLPHLHLLPSLTLWDSQVFGLYVLTLIVGHTTLPISISRTPEISLIAPVHYTQMLWGILYGFVIFAEPPSPTTLLGGAMIIGGGLYMIWRERHHVRHPKKSTTT